MKTKKQASKTSRFTRGVKVGAKKTGRQNRRPTGESRPEGVNERVQDRLTPL